jgi:hypothetical protein
MDIIALTEFFMWCTIINAAIMAAGVLAYMAISDFVYRVHTRWFDISRQNFDAIFYSIFAFYKVIFVFFNLVPWIVLLIIR